MDGHLTQIRWFPMGGYVTHKKDWPKATPENRSPEPGFLR